MTDDAMLADTDFTRALRGRLVDELVDGGHLTDPAWEQALRAVPRHRFVPAYFIDAGTGDGGWKTVTAESDWGAWVRGAYTDEPIVTQLAGSVTPDKTTGSIAFGPATCSSSQPSLMTLMLQHLQVEDGMHVLELGTGVGFNAALLAERLGAGYVTSIEIDPDLASGAADHLAATGYDPTLLIADGAKGYPAGAPYDRVIATCGFPEVPNPWLAQVTPGGIILVNLWRPLAAGALVALRVRDDEYASGHFTADWAGFMPTRAFADHEAMELFSAIDHDNVDEGRPTELSPDELQHDGFRLLASLTVPGRLMDVRFDDDQVQSWLLADDGSWSRHSLSADGEGFVAESGPQQLWTMLETAWQTWTHLGRPGRDAFGLTVTPAEHTLWHGDESGWSVTIRGASAIE